MKNGEKPAYPTTIQGKYGDYIENGLTKREVFAMAAMQGYLASYAGSTVDPASSVVAGKSVEYADAILALLEKTGEKP